jgi:hypothetical protein
MLINLQNDFSKPIIQTYGLFNKATLSYFLKSDEETTVFIFMSMFASTYYQILYRNKNG